MAAIYYSKIKGKHRWEVEETVCTATIFDLCEEAQRRVQSEKLFPFDLIEDLERLLLE